MCDCLWKIIINKLKIKKWAERKSQFAQFAHGKEERYGVYGFQVTYNKRRNGLFKKVIEISAMCGVSVRLEMVDPYGNHVTIDAPSRMPSRKAKNKPQNICIFGQSDVSSFIIKYPEFKGLPETQLPKRRFRRYRRSPSISSDSDEAPSSESLLEQDISAI